MSQYEREEQEYLLLQHNMDLLNDSSLISIVENSEEENIIRLQVAWDILEKRGLKEAVLSKIELEDETKKISLDELLHPENGETVSDTTFAEKIEFLVGSEIKVNQRDMLGVYKGASAKEVDLDTRILSREEKDVLLKKFRVQLILSAFSVLILAVIYAADLSFNGVVFVEWGLLFHTLFRLFMAFSTYMTFKNES